MEAPPDSWARVGLHRSGLSAVAHLPRPIAVGDVAALERGPLLRIVRVEVAERGEIAAEVERVRLVLSG